MYFKYQMECPKSNNNSSNYFGPIAVGCRKLAQCIGILLLPMKSRILLRKYIPDELSGRKPCN